MSNTNISKLRNPDMEITVFREAKNIQEGQLFIARKDSVEGRDKAILTPIDNSVCLVTLADGTPHMVFRSLNEGKAYLARNPEVKLNVDCYTVHEGLVQ